MPTYENPTSSAKMVKNSAGGFEPLMPGETIETLYFNDHAALGLNEISEAPYYNQVAGDAVVDLTGSYQSVPISLDAKFVLFLGSSGTITAYAQNENNEPPLLREHTSSMVVIPIRANQRYRQVRVKGSGRWRVLQTREK